MSYPLVATDLFVCYVGIDSAHVEAMEHEWHPRPSRADVRSVVCNELIVAIDTAHPCIIVGNDLGHVYTNCVLVSPEFSDVAPVILRNPRAFSICLTNFVRLVPCGDKVNGAVVDSQVI